MACTPCAHWRCSGTALAAWWTEPSGVSVTWKSCKRNRESSCPKAPSFFILSPLAVDKKAQFFAHHHSTPPPHAGSWTTTTWRRWTKVGFTACWLYSSSTSATMPSAGSKPTPGSSARSLPSCKSSPPCQPSSLHCSTLNSCALSRHTPHARTIAQ